MTIQRTLCLITRNGTHRDRESVIFLVFKLVSNDEDNTLPGITSPFLLRFLMRTTEATYSLVEKESAIIHGR